MATPDSSIGAKLQSLPRTLLYLILLLATSLPLIYGELAGGVSVPNQPLGAAVDFYAALMKIPPGKTVLLETDWTNSTRGENGGEFDAILRILMARGIKFAVFSTADPQAPQVAMDDIATINALRVQKGQKAYVRWTDWVNLGYFPNSEGTLNALAGNLATAFNGKKDVKPGGGLVDVFESPVLKGYTKLTDIPAVILVTASATSTVMIERLSGKVPLDFMVTGVMGPETQVYYSSKQLEGLVIGLKGVYDLETLMKQGLNGQGPDAVPSQKYAGQDVPPVNDNLGTGKGSAYYPTLHFALALLILAVIVGNVGMLLTRKRTAQ